MTDIRCPMCGKPNPPDAENCKYCEARLQPVTGNQDEFDWQELPGGDQEEEIPDWLKELRPPAGEGLEARQEDFGGDVDEERFSEVFQDQPQEKTDFKDFEISDEALPGEEDAGGLEGGALDFPEPERDFSFLGEQSVDAEAEEQELPDWFTNYEGDPEPEKAPGWSEDVPPIEAEELGEEELPAGGDTPEETEGPYLGENEPDWLVKVRQRHEAEEAEKSRQNQDSLEWLNYPPFPDMQPPPEEIASQKDEPREEEPDYGLLAPEGKTSAEEAGEPLPDWLARLEKDSQDISDSEIEADPQKDRERDEAREDLPDWLAQFSREKNGEEDVEETVEEGEAAAPGDLPDWLEAMRPIDSAAPSIPFIGEEDARPEKVGPLAGLRAVLPAEPEFGQFKKPPVYSIKLRLTEHQQANAALLESMLAAEEEAKPVSARSRIGSQALLRLLITVILILVVLLPRWVDLGGLGPTAAMLEDSSEVLRQVQQLPAGAPVLVGFDFEPGLSAELDSASEMFISRLWERNLNLAVVSTLPVGPINAERYFRPLSRLTGGPEASYVNLGFIAGGPAGLRSFAENPQRVLPFDMEAIHIWNRAPFNGIDTLADFAMLVVITENPETARAWIEQVRTVTASADIPFIMIVSAQAEPLVRPYYTAGMPGQVSGMLVGWAGGAAMESLVGAPGPVTANWSVFGMGLTAAAVLLLVGGLISLVIVFMDKRRESDRDEDLL
jgi:hypothetical protein